MSNQTFDQRFAHLYDTAAGGNQQRHPDLQHSLLGPGGLSAMAQSEELRALQMKGDGDADGMHATAAQGVAGSGGRLPHGERIQAAFGHHDVSDVQAHVGGAAEQAAMLMNAQAYATGRSVAFAHEPDLHTAAHEAAHVVQQRGGVSLKGGVGQAGDAHERHADAVADAVVAGRSAEGLLDQYAGSGGGGEAVQCKETEGDPKTAGPARDIDALIESAVVAIAQKETNQKATESLTDTSAGVKASYPSQIQATVGWTLTALKKLSPASRKKFGVTLKDLRAAEVRAQATQTLWKAAMGSGDATAEDLTKDATVKKALTTSGLSEADVTRMLAFRDLRVAMDAAGDAELAKAAAAKGKPLTYRERKRAYRAAGNAAAAHEANKALGMGGRSLRNYIRKDKEPDQSKMWREDLAGWQRKAVESGAKGTEIKKAAAADEGLALGRARIGDIVRGYARANPKATDEQVVKHAAKRHNPGRGYTEDVVLIWRAQEKSRAKAQKGAEAATASAKEVEGPVAKPEESVAEAKVTE